MPQVKDEEIALSNPRVSATPIVAWGVTIGGPFAVLTGIATLVGANALAGIQGGIALIGLTIGALVSARWRRRYGGYSVRRIERRVQLLDKGLIVAEWDVDDLEMMEVGPTWSISGHVLDFLLTFPPGNPLPNLLVLDQERTPIGPTIRVLLRREDDLRDLNARLNRMLGRGWDIDGQ